MQWAVLVQNITDVTYIADEDMCACISTSGGFDIMDPMWLLGKIANSIDKVTSGS